MEQQNWMKRFYEWNRDIYWSISDRFYDGKTGLSLEDVKRKKEEYAEEFSEGCDSLKKLLSHLWDNDIETMACCAGHANVIRYEKDTFLGRMEVSENAAIEAKRKNKKGYYRIEEFSTPYLMFKSPENCQAIADDIKKNLEKQGLSIEFHVDFDKRERISIYNESFFHGQENSVDKFFNAVYAAIDQALGISEKEIEKQIETQPKKESLKESSNEKRSLSSLIQNAEVKQKANEKEKPFVPHKEAQFSR